MLLSEFIEATKDFPRDTPIIVAPGFSARVVLDMIGLEPDPNYKHCAKVFSISDAADAIILEL